MSTSPPESGAAAVHRVYELEHLAPELHAAVRATPAVKFESVFRARFGIALMHLFMPRVATAGVRVRDQKVAPRAGGPKVRVRLYEPEAPNARKGGRPAMVFAHWGGFVVGGLKTEHRRCVWLCRELGMTVVSVDYRLAPENPFPAGLDDCFAALRWLIESAEALGVDRTCIAVGGTSAGGGLAAGLALRARNEGVGLRWQYLGFPVLDATCSTRSATAHTDTPNWTAQANQLMWEYYLQGKPPTELASPLSAATLEGLPETVLWTAEFDPLHDEAVRYAERLKAAGVATHFFDYPAAMHGFDSLPIEEGIVARARRDQTSVIQSIFAGDRPSAGRP